MNNVLLLLGALLVGLLAALVAVPMMVDWNGYRGVFEEEASNLLGRDVRVGGAVNVRVLPVPYVRFEKLRIADISSTGGDPLFRAESVTMRLSIAPLLRGVLEAQSVELKKPQLRLAVDAQGRGNWRSLSLKSGALPFVPGDVTLQSVGITDGTLLFVSASGKDLADFQAIDGELSADGFEGPFKFKGMASWYGDRREIRFATSKPEADGATHLRASVRLPSNLNTYQFDGKMVDLKGRPRLDGELTAKLPIGAVNGKAPIDETNAFELKAKVDGDLNGGKLSDIALSLERAGDPQLITGEVKAAWGDALRFDMALASRSLDLDWMGGDPTTRDPLETARNALNMILASIPLDAQTDARLKAERVTLAGEHLTGVTIAMNRRGTLLEVKELRAVMPGNTRLEASGSITRDGNTSAFNGPITLRGANLAKFLNWARNDSVARPTPTAAAQQYEGSFLFDGQLAMSGPNIAVTRVVAEFADQPVTGEFRLTNEGRKRVAIVLQGQRIDLAQIWPGGLDLERLRAALTGSPAPQTTAAAGAGFYGINPDTTDIKVEIRAAELQVTGTTSLRDADAAFSVERGKLTIPRVKFQTSAGLSVDLDGQLAGLTVAPIKSTEAAPAKKGVIRFVIGAPNAGAASDLFTYLDLPAANRPSDATIASLGPIRLAGSANLGERSATSTGFAIDGTIDGGRIVATGQLERGVTDWRTGVLDLNATIETANIGRWLGFAGMGAGGGPRAILAHPGQLFIKASGQPGVGLTTLATVTSDNLSVAYQGLVALPKEGVVIADGAAGIAAREGGDVLALADLSLGQGNSGLPLEGQVVMKLQDGAMSLATHDMAVGGARLSGTALLKAAKTGSQAVPAREFQADLKLDAATVAGLLAVISDRRSESAANPSSDRTRSVWSDQPISYAGLDGAQGRVKLAIGRLGLDGAPLMTNAAANITFAPGAVTIEELTGKGMGGSLKARIALQKSPGGTQLKAEGTLAEGNVNGSVPLTLTSTLTSQGLSPSGLVAALQGKGQAAIGAGMVKGVAPAGVAATVDSVLAAKTPPTGEDLASALRDSLAPTSFALPPRTIAFAVNNGVARVPATAFEGQQGRAFLESTVDLNVLRYSTDWRIEAAAKPGVTGKPKAPLPAVVVSMSGGLSNLAEADSKLTNAAFEQELALRKLERDAEELERIRKLDDDRRQKEQAEKAAAAAAADAAAAAQSTPPPPGENSGAPAGVPAPVEAVRPASGLPAANGATSTGDPAASAGTASAPPAGTASATQQPQTAPPTAQPNSTPRPAQSSVTRRREQGGIPQPFQNNF